jgi:hypothetical protein
MAISVNKIDKGAKMTNIIEKYLSLLLQMFEYDLHVLS